MSKDIPAFTFDEDAASGAVVPKRDCPHITVGMSSGAVAIDILGSCGKCSSSESWVCLSCASVNCGRFVKAHAKDHFVETRHSIAISTSDLNIWCYQCESYIESQALDTVYNTAYRQKFGEDAPELKSAEGAPASPASSDAATVPAPAAVPAPATVSAPAPAPAASTAAAPASGSGSGSSIFGYISDLANSALQAIVGSASSSSSASATPAPARATATGSSKWDGIDASAPGAVHPIENCPHVAAFVTSITTVGEDGKEELKRIDTSEPCKSCDDIHENWICLKCHKVGCSRFVNGHASSHFAETGHAIAMSYSDFSVWCYGCDSYIKDERLFSILEAAHIDKFGFKPSDKSKAPRSLTGHKTDEDAKEIFDEPEVVKEKVAELAKIIKASGYVVAYTGAGISTSAKIPDYRGPSGVWTLREKGLEARMEVRLDEVKPTPAHMALLEMKRRGILKFLVSTNVDGLHRRSGFGKDEMSELHGNTYLEFCPGCKKEYLRKYLVSSSRPDHKTGRKCDDCGEKLLDSIINFGEKLPIPELEKTYTEAKKSDVALVLGTSMRVQPANLFPEFCLENKGKMVIVNLQKTPFDGKAALIIRARTDEVMKMLSEHLELEIPEYDESVDFSKKA